MYANKSRRVPSVDNPDVARRAPDWEGIRLFLEVARHGSFRAAAEHTNTSINLLRRRIVELEETLGLKLMTRHVTGIKITPEGETVLAAASQMEEASFGFSLAGERNKPVEGKVRLAMSEGLGSFWVVPRLIELQRVYPRLLVDLNCSMKSADALRLEADVVIQFQRPTSPDLKVMRLGRLHIAPFASRGYLEANGSPTTREELLNHRVVLCMQDQTIGQKIYEKMFPGKDQVGFVSMIHNIPSAHYWAIARGAGIGWLPTYASLLGESVVPIELDQTASFDIWLSYHPDAAHIPRVRTTIDWMVKAFDSDQLPWFRDEFICPKELARVYRGPALEKIFGEDLFGPAPRKQAAG